MADVKPAKFCPPGGEATFENPLARKKKKSVPATRQGDYLVCPSGYAFPGGGRKFNTQTGEMSFRKSFKDLDKKKFAKETIKEFGKAITSPVKNVKGVVRDSRKLAALLKERKLAKKSKKVVKNN